MRPECLIHGGTGPHSEETRLGPARTESKERYMLASRGLCERINICETSALGDEEVTGPLTVACIKRAQVVTASMEDLPNFHVF